MSTLAEASTSDTGGWTTIQALSCMGKIGLLPENLQARAEFLEGLGVPVKYMEDYTVLGIIVDRYRDSLAILHDSGFAIEQGAAGSLISLEKPSALGEILRLLQDKQIRCDYKDIADTFYQS